MDFLLTLFSLLIKKQYQDTTATDKKTDAVQPDDKPSENKEDSTEESSPKTKKSDLEVKEGADAADNEEDSGKDSTEDVDGGASEEKETEVCCVYIRQLYY